MLRRIPGHRHRRRHDPRPAVHASVRARRRGGRDLERAARRLYKDGLNRALFLPFIALLKSAWKSCGSRRATDFRLEKLAGMHGLARAGRCAADAALDTAWRRYGGPARRAVELSVKGRSSTCRARRWAWRGSPSRICASSRLGRRLSARSRTNFTPDCRRHPGDGPGPRNEARRFILLIDTLYDNAREARRLGRGRAGRALPRHRGL